MNSLLCCYTNAQGLLSKFTELYSRALSASWNLISITETWLSDSILDAEIHIPGMTIYRKDRATKGGGVAVYLKSDICCTIIDHPELNVPDSLFCSIDLLDNNRCLLCVIYRPPNSSYDADIALSSALRHVMELPYSHILLLGDFNLPTLFKPSECSHYFRDFFHELLVCTPLYNHVHHPTRSRSGQNPSILDLILTNEELMVETVQYATPLGLSDHTVLTFDYVFQCTIKDPVLVERTKVDYEQLRELVTVNCWEFSSCVNATDHWNQFYTQLMNLINTASIRTLVRPNENPRKPIRSRTRKWMCKRDTAWLEYHRNPSIVSWHLYTLLRNKCVCLLRDDRKSYQQDQIARFVSNPKLLYKHINNLRSVRVGIPPLQTPVGPVSHPKERANALRDHFASVVSQSSNIDIPFCPARIDPASLENVDFTSGSVRSVLKNLKKKSSPGPDEIRPELLNQLSYELAEPIAMCFSKLFDQCVVPEIWKTAYISPIHKGGKRNDPTNYRPIALLSVFSKVMESIITQALRDHFENHALINEAQHGFRKRRSCVTNLMLAKEDWSNSIDAGYAVDVIYIDFSKAFDRVSHQHLLSKLWNYGVKGKLFNWIEEWLAKREMYVRVDGELSRSITVSCGVPQGSVLGPLLFLIYVNDLPTHLQSHVLMFADDVKIWRKITAPDDNRLLQDDLNAIHEWSRVNGMPMNSAKCKSLSLYKESCHVYYLGGSAIASVSQEKDLGVVIQSDLGSTGHCSLVSKRAELFVGLLRRALGQFDSSIIQALITSYIRPHVEYAMQVWDPWLKKDIRLLERPQRVATKLVKGLHHRSYEDRLRSLNLHSAEYRRLRGSLLFVWTVLHQADHPLANIFDLFPSSRTRGHHLKLNQKYSRLNCRKFSFPVRIAPVWNSLPVHIVSSKTKDDFKRQLDTFMGEYVFAYT